MPFDSVLGQDHAKELMREALARRRLGHAYLFAGLDGVGKTLFAIDLAKALLCRGEGEKPCGACADCRMADHGRHPDLFMVQADEERRAIRIEQARELSRSLNLKPVQAEHRVAVLREAERMTDEAANSLLKLLEEPPAFATLILTSSQPRALPDTIRSRCQELRFAPLSPEHVRRILSGRPEHDEAEVALAAQFAEGSAGRAIQIIESGCLEMYGNVSQRVFALPQGDIFEIADEILDWTGAVSSRLEIRRRRLRELLRMFGCGYRDALLLRVEAPQEMLFHAAGIGPMRRLAECLPAGRIMRILDAVFGARRQTDANADMALILENLFARICELQTPA